ncbi:MAG: NAD-dependent epimerase/dehydratase family protein [Gemmatales bacterium]|nr:NAD-dependent epimerase/dehydratase family protein [Gemmatales bacterium]MDW7993507.1 NAD-dependent epimerase/dehydratase family protein [Gemmatales bacterium]
MLHETANHREKWLVTGATGFIGSHVVEALVQRNQAVVALARPASDVSALEARGVEIVRGDLCDVAALEQACRDVQLIVHCAARVGDWGPVDDYRRVNVEGLRQLLEAARRQPIRRFIHISSLGVYAARDHYGTDESEPLPERHIDGYTQTKVEAERLAWQYLEQYAVPIVILRPGFVYGARDRTVLPRLLEALAKGEVRYLGSGEQAMNTIYVGNLVQAILLAAEVPQAIGQVYNLTDGEYVSKRRFFETLARVAELPPPSRRVPRWLAWLVAYAMEAWARWRGSPEPPRLTRARVKFLGLHLDFSIEKARRELGYQPESALEKGLREAVAWYRRQQAAAAQKPAVAPPLTATTS